MSELYKIYIGTSSVPVALTTTIQQLSILIEELFKENADVTEIRIEKSTEKI